MSSSQPDPPDPAAPNPDVLQSWWMPFTANRQFKAHPHLIAAAEGAYYILQDGRRVFDCLSGMWCTPLGHSHPGVVRAVRKQVERLDFCPTFQVGHAPAFELAARIAKFAGRPQDRVFFVNSGSEAVDTALKIAIAYHSLRGEAARTRVIGRERAYHGVGIGGMSVGGIASNRKLFAALMLPAVDHLPHTHALEDMRFTRGQPDWGLQFAEQLQRLVALHDASTIAAVIVEPVQGSTGVIVPPRGYLRRLREICTKHGILLIFDEVITGFGRLGEPFAADLFEVKPDLLTFAKAVTNGVVPMGGVLVRADIYEAFMTGPPAVIEFSHGHTCSAHPLAVAAAHASLDALIDDRMVERAATLAPVLERAVHGLRGEPHVIDIRNIGLSAAVELAPLAGQSGIVGSRVFERALGEGLLVRRTNDTIALAPPFISTAQEIESMVEGLRRSLRAVPVN